MYEEFKWIDGQLHVRHDPYAQFELASDKVTIRYLKEAMEVAIELLIIPEHKKMDVEFIRGNNIATKGYLQNKLGK